MTVLAPAQRRGARVTGCAPKASLRERAGSPGDQGQDQGAAAGTLRPGPGPSGGLTCSLVTLSASSVRTRSPSVNLTCSSCSWASAFFRLCSESPLPCSRTFTSLASSPRSFSRVCFAFSRLAFTCGDESQEVERGGCALAGGWESRPVQIRDLCSL